MTQACKPTPLGHAFVTTILAAALAVLLAATPVPDARPVGKSSPPAATQSAEAAITCAANLRQLGWALQMYAHLNRGKLPADLGTVVNMTNLEPDTLVCPSGDEKPVPGLSISEQAANLTKTKGRHVSYLCAGAGLRLKDLSDQIIACDRAHRHGGGINVLYGDGAVQYVAAVQAQPILDALAEGRPAPRPAPLAATRTASPGWTTGPAAAPKRQPEASDLCAARLKELFVRLETDANDNRGRFTSDLPALLQKLLAAGVIQDAGLLVCPDGPETPAPGKTPAEMAARLSKNGHLSYRYRGAGLKKGGRDDIIVYELPGHHGGRIHVLYGDGKVRFFDHDRSKEAIDRFAKETAGASQPPVP